MKHHLIMLAAVACLIGGCASQRDNTAGADARTNDVRRVDTSVSGSASAGRPDAYDPAAIGHPADDGRALDSGNLPTSAAVRNGPRGEGDSVGTSTGAISTPKRPIRHRARHGRRAPR